jgi:hypothetical protein
MFKNARAIKYN